MNVLDNSVIIKGSNSGITVFLDNEMAFEDLLESVSEKFKSASKFLTMLIWRFLLMEGFYLLKRKRILDVISDVSELNIVCVLDENNNMKEIYEDAVKKAIASVDISEPLYSLLVIWNLIQKLHVCFIKERFVLVRYLKLMEASWY